MARIVLGMWTSHGPTLSSTAEQWLLRVPWDRKKNDHPFRGRTYDFETLVELRRDEHLAAQCSCEEREKRAAACTRAIGKMADAFAAVAPDVAVIMGNDQSELFLDDVIPAITVFRGPTLWDQPADAEQAARMPPGIHEAEWGHSPPQYTEYPGLPDLATHIIRTAVGQGFDVAASQRLPVHPGHWSSGMPHAFGFVYRQLMRDRVVPNVPVILNTFFPPNQPTARRCFELGRLVGRAIRSWPEDRRVAVFGSGGMSHFVIDEDLDRRVFDALARRDAEALCGIEESYLQSGSSELKNWIAAAGILFDTDLAGGVVDYQPCYRSAAGTGTANGFVCWR
ncbi:MAG: protocatechuate 3,4-dioxygenase [Steroidobacteraceae bacterium]